MGPGPR